MISADRIRNLSAQQRTLLLERLHCTHDFNGGNAPKELVAYLVCLPGQSASDEALRQFMKNHLPDFMTPAQFVFLNALPRHPNGKVNRHALPAPVPETTPMAIASRAPENEIEVRLAQIWAELLRLETVGVQDNFFRLGGHSLLALQVMARVRDVFKIDLPLKALFDSPTVDGLAKMIAQRSSTHAPIQKIPRRNGVAPGVIIPSQDRTQIDH